MKLGSIGLLAVLALATLAAPNAAAQPVKPVTLGILEVARPPGSTGPARALVEALRDLGYEESRNLTIEFRSADGRNENLPKLAAELVSLKPDVIVAASTPAVVAVKKATSETPIVMIGVGGPVATGLVQSLARPGGNVTGRSNASGEVAQKRLQLVTEAIPGICCVTMLSNPANPGNVAMLPIMNSAAKSLGIELKMIEAADPGQLEQALAAPLEDRFRTALYLFPDVLFVTRRAEIIESAVRRGLAVFAPFQEDAVAGALMAYGVNIDDEYRAAAVYVDKILKGAKPAELPVEQPTRFKLVINLKTAKALGLTIPPLLLGSADEVIE